MSNSLHLEFGELERVFRSGGRLFGGKVEA